MCTEHSVPYHINIKNMYHQVLRVPGNSSGDMSSGGSLIIWACCRLESGGFFHSNWERKEGKFQASVSNEREAWTYMGRWTNSSF